MQLPQQCTFGMGRQALLVESCVLHTEDGEDSWMYGGKDDEVVRRRLVGGDAIVRGGQ